MRNLLGGNGSGLAEMTRLGLPVPPGFIITTDTCRAYMQTGNVPEGLMESVAEHLKNLESSSGKHLSDPEASVPKRRGRRPRWLLEAAHAA
ncbi:MAG TPA: PEP/pyruvate-binding domain-containing protein [Rubrobacter sp.]|nr:PEP/pyruvate-binding domain-containing protein [Rubrobacter sp.]